MVAVQNQVNIRRGRKSFHHPSSAFGDYGLLPPSQETPCDRYKLWIFPTSSSSNFRNRDSSNNTISSWSSTWLLRILDGKNLQPGNWDYKKGN